MKEATQASSNIAPNFTHTRPSLADSERRQLIIDTAMAFPFENVLKRYAKDEDLPWDVALEHERELKRYLAICAMNPGKSVGMAGLIDELWHVFVMFTREYHNFCSLVAGRYLHHSPANEGDDPELGRKAYLYFWEQYRAMFDEVPPVHLWPDPATLLAYPAECYNACDGLCSCNNLCSCQGTQCGCYA